jgi:hypothetical protein
MGLLASIFAYLSAVAAIIILFLMSADALLNQAHHQATNPRSELVTAATINPHKLGKVAPAAQNSADAIPKTGTAVDYRRKVRLSNTRLEERHGRALRREQEARNWALGRERATAPLALGYAQEPVPRSGDVPWR